MHQVTTKQEIKDRIKIDRSIIIDNLEDLHVSNIVINPDLNSTCNKDYISVTFNQIIYMKRRDLGTTTYTRINHSITLSDPNNLFDMIITIAKRFADLDEY